MDISLIGEGKSTTILLSHYIGGLLQVQSAFTKSL